MTTFANAWTELAMVYGQRFNALTPAQRDALVADVASLMTDEHLTVAPAVRLLNARIAGLLERYAATLVAGRGGHGGSDDPRLPQSWEH